MQPLPPFATGDRLSDLIVTHALVVTADAAGTVIRDGAVAVKGGRIDRLGPAAEIGTGAREVIDAGGMILMPGLINTHCHAADSLFRGLVEDLPLEPWLRQVWKAEAAILDRDTVRLGATLGFAEQLLGGVTTVMDMFWHPARRWPRRGRWASGSRRAASSSTAPASTATRPATGWRRPQRFFDDFAGADDVLPGCFPHGAYTVGPERLRRPSGSRPSGAASSRPTPPRPAPSRRRSTARYGRSVVRHLDALGLLDARTVLAHCVWLDDEEIAILARTGATVAHNPVSNLKLASGIARVPDMLAAGVRVTVGTDGAISGQRPRHVDGAPPRRDAAPGGAARRDGGDDRAGAAHGDARRGGGARGGGPAGLARGGQARRHDPDRPRRRPHAVPLFDPATHIVFSTAKSDVRHVFVGGRQVVRDGSADRASTSARRSTR